MQYVWGRGYFINVRNTHVCYVWNLTSCVVFTKREILVRNILRNGTYISRVVRNWNLFFTVRNLRSVKLRFKSCYVDLLYNVYLVTGSLNFPHTESFQSFLSSSNFC